MYADSMTVAEAREQYFAQNGFTLAGYTLISDDTGGVIYRVSHGR
jgi:hypothetical protein